MGSTDALTCLPRAAGHHPTLDPRLSALLGNIAILLLTVLCCFAAPAAEPPSKPASLKVSGYGLLGDLRLKRMLRLTAGDKTPPEFYSATFVEDAVLLLRSRLREDGHLRPVIRADLVLEDGRRLRYTFTRDIEEPLPRSLRIRQVRFKIREGVLYHFARLDFYGLSAIPVDQARRYFIETGGILRLKRNRVYSSERLDRGIASLTAELNRLGYADARAEIEQLDENERNGRVTVDIQVNQGPRYIVRSVRQEVFLEDAAVPIEVKTNRPGRPYWKGWEQDFEQRILTNYFHRGYPDATVDLKILAREPGRKDVQLDLGAVVHTGPRVRVHDVLFHGNRRTRESVLESRVPVREGEWLDRIDAERGRYRLSQLGIFESAQLSYAPVDEHARDVLYELEEGKRLQVKLLFGYGSYELLRGGVQFDHYNVFGLAHHSQLRLVQSFKASSGEYTYTIPAVFGRDVDLFVTGSGLRREEISFTRVEYGGGAGVRKFFRAIKTDASLRYNYGILEATEASVNFAEAGAENPTVGELIADVRHDRRDNPLYPRRGYQVLGNFEFATEYLGGEVNFQRVEIGASYHWPLSDSQWLHFGLRHGAVGTIGGTTDNLPFARRFFPGGENSVRGYQQGEASPRDETGKIVGAETYISGNVQIEQGLTRTWSLVAFIDGVGFARHLADYPGNETLFSAGGGLNWRTILGPVRLEYGHNLNPRPKDPSGTFQFSLGFPF